MLVREPGRLRGDRWARASHFLEREMLADLKSQISPSGQNPEVAGRRDSFGRCGLNADLWAWQTIQRPSS